MRRPLRFALVLALSLCLAIDPASACNWIMARGSACRPYRTYCQPIYQPCDPCYVVPQCGEVIVSSGCCESHVEHSDTPSVPTPPAGQPTPAGSRVNKPADSEMLPPAPRDPAPELEDEAEFTQPAPVEEPPAPPMEEPAPIEQQPEPPVAPVQPLEQAPAEPAPVAEEPAFNFDEPAAPAEPAPAPAPADDNLFGEPAAPAEQPAPAEEPAAPADEPAPADDGFGLFSDTPLGEEPSPAEEPAPQEEPAPAQEPAPADEFNFFDTPAEEAPAPSEPAPADQEPTPMEEEPAPAEEPAEEEGSALDDLFDFGSILTQPGGFDSLALRRWTDNTGSYQVDARMLSVSGTHVKLMKATGRTTTVPLSRLSSADLEFVNLQASAQKAEAISRTAQR